MTEYKISKGLYNKEAILKVVYTLQKEFNISITEDEFNYICNVEPKCDVAFDFSRFNNGIQEQQLRETLSSQFGELRNAIYSKAFEHFER